MAKRVKTLAEEEGEIDPGLQKEIKLGVIAFRHYAAIGQVAATWSRFEEAVDYWCMRLARLPPDEGTCFTDQVIGISRKLDCFFALAGLRKLPSLAPSRFEAFSKKVSGLTEQRNRAVHDVWHFAHDTPPKRAESSAKKVLKRRMVEEDTATLHKTARNTQALIQQFEAMAEEIDLLPAASPETPKR